MLSKHASGCCHTAAQTQSFNQKVETAVVKLGVWAGSAYALANDILFKMETVNDLDRF